MRAWCEYLAEFWFLLPVAVLAAPALFMAGTQALAQSKTLDIFILVQGAVIGHLMALAIGLEGGGELALCYLFAAVAVFISHLFEKVATTYQSATRISFYAFLLVLVYVFERWVPGLERHVNSAIVGDFLFLNHSEVLVLIGVLAVYFFYNYKTLDVHLNRFFSKQVLKLHKRAAPEWFFFNFLLLVSATHFLGLSFVLGFAVLLPLCFSLGLADKSIKSFILSGILGSGLLAGLSLLVSFAFPDQSTSPFVVVLSVGGLMLIFAGRNLVRNR